MSKIKHPKEEEFILELVKTYTQAQSELINIVSNTKVKRNANLYKRVLLQRVNEVVSKLNKQSIGWTNKYIPSEYKRALERVRSQYKQLGIETDSFQKNKNKHIKQINLLVENSVTQLTKANNFIGRNVRDNIRDISNKTIRQSILQGKTFKQLQEDLKNEFINNNITAIKTRNGRYINLDSYSSIVARSTVTETENRAVMEQVKLSNNDLVRMSSHLTSCPVCAPLQGRVYSVSGKSKLFPPLHKAFSGVYANIHPNCRHFLIPYSPEKDKNLGDTIKDSNKSFDVDPRSQSQIDNYNKIQKENQKRNNDKKQWERYKIVLPELTHLTLSGFRRAKRKNNERYQKLLEEYRKIRLLTP